MRCLSDSLKSRITVDFLQIRIQSTTKNNETEPKLQNSTKTRSLKFLINLFFRLQLTNKLEPVTKLLRGYNRAHI